MLVAREYFNGHRALTFGAERQRGLQRREGDARSKLAHASAACRVAAFANKKARGGGQALIERIPEPWRHTAAQLITKLSSEAKDLSLQVYINGNGFQQRLAREVTLVEHRRVPDHIQGENLLAWLVSLVYRNALLIPGMPRIMALPPGFHCGRASGAENNCFIHTVVQLVANTEVDPSDAPFLARCRNIRADGVVAGKWAPSPADIEANAATLEFAVAAAGGNPDLWRLVCHAGFDGMNVELVGPAAAVHQMHAFNRCGTHYVPLWPVAADAVHRAVHIATLCGRSLQTAATARRPAARMRDPELDGASQQKRPRAESDGASVASCNVDTGSTESIASPSMAIGRSQERSVKVVVEADEDAHSVLSRARPMRRAGPGAGGSILQLLLQNQMRPATWDTESTSSK